ncbi:sensor histidine kinase [Streptomyces griseorubiginosus]|uniref:sensor histidine kinase n=1 Tax=Streptomyces griseorubiginosus TaxID=67304 RepID=UPI001AD75B80|nr:ATP-binding protein [Streptomyces griseorubiginosus]MBO4260112.1 ATP-binding protein [Streptomyces griseorubiginosus]
MSHLRAPAARADRREGGRHGRPVARTVASLPETHIRPQLLRLAVLPPIAVALSASAAVLFTVRSTGVRPGLTLWGVLGGAVSVALAGIVTAAVAADRAARTVSERIATLRRSAARGEADLRALVEALRRGEAPPQRTPRGAPADDADDFELLAADLSRAHDGAVTAVVQAAQLSSQAGSEQKLEVFVNLARRLQSLVHREISILDELENEMEDPDLLKGLFHVDHLATRIRRHAENLAVLGGAVSRRQWSHPVSMTEVLRSAIAEVEQYSRVKLVPPIDGTLRGHAVADVIHLLAELVENATVFSAPHTQVLLRANLVTSGLAVEVEDRGLGMPVAEQKKMNALLADPDQVNVASLLADGRIGLFVVSQLARRHGIHVRLQTNIYGGVQAVLVVPQGLLGPAQGIPGAVPHPHGAAATPAQSSGPGPATGGHPVVPPPPTPRRVESWESTGTASVTPNAGTSASPVVGGAGAGGGTRAGAAANGASVNDSMASDGTTGTTGTTRGAVPRGSGPDSGTADGGLPDGAGADLSAARGGTAGGAGGGHATGQGSGPAPLPVRDARGERPNPAEAVPGIRPDDRRVVAESVAAPATPRTGTVRGTMGKPQLPRRRAQEHIAPQLRDGPAPRQDTDAHTGHDPGLMAAFQRGVGLAEAQQHLEADHMGSAPMGADPMAAPPMERSRLDALDDMGGAHMSAQYTSASGHPDASPSAVRHTAGAHTDASATTPPPHGMDVPRMDVSRMDVPRRDVPRMDVQHRDVPRMDPAHIAEARPAAARGHDRPTRHDGSAPAG